MCLDEKPKSPLIGSKEMEKQHLRSQRERVGVIIK